MNTCRECTHYEGRDAPEGRCRRFPPTATGHGNPDRAAAYAWPVVAANGGCSDSEWFVAANGGCSEWSALDVVEPVPAPEVAKRGKAAK